MDKRHLDFQGGNNLTRVQRIGKYIVMDDNKFNKWAPTY
jgi:hypothetical protein